MQFKYEIGQIVVPVPPSTKIVGRRLVENENQAVVLYDIDVPGSGIAKGIPESELEPASLSQRDEFHKKEAALLVEQAAAQGAFDAQMKELENVPPATEGNFPVKDNVVEGDFGGNTSVQVVDDQQSQNTSG